MIGREVMANLYPYSNNSVENNYYNYNHNIDLAPVQFRDGLALHYLRHPSNLPAKYDVVGLISLSNMPLAVREGDLLYCTTMRFMTALEM